ncbi:hypothetical protein [Nocardioides sambongensis]|uniref:hypothetical protein n=1 Tax=Nocardioides sambongensis TaxID=2589074 RepID=UPI0011265937|nr:hypothetical protein [Nocardioides sambongensis]
MTLKYHQSPDSGTWTRCVARGASNGGRDCPFGAPTVDHLDRTEIALRSGGILRTTQGGKEKRFVVTPVIGGAYAVVGADGTARTYTEKGELIPAKARRAFYDSKLMPALTDRQSAKDSGGGEETKSDGSAPVHSTPDDDGSDAAHGSGKSSSSAPVRGSSSAAGKTPFRQSAKDRAKARHEATKGVLRWVGTLAAGHGSTSASPAHSAKMSNAWSFLVAWFAQLFTDTQL